MKKCLKITVFGTLLDATYKTMAQKNAQNLDLEGSLQNIIDNNITIYACGQAENLDKFIDVLYKGTQKSVINELLVEPFINEKDFRNVFRIIGD